MSQELNLTKEELEALDRIDSELKGLPRGGAAGGKSTAMASFDPADLCERYHKIKAYLRILVKLLRKIPKIGEKAADAIEFLMGLADIACPA